MILHEYAVEPESIVDSWETFRYVTEKFGFSQGRLISRFPADWDARVRDQCSRRRTTKKGLRTIERHMIIEALSRLRTTKLVNNARVWIDREFWAANVTAEHRRKPFRGVISRTNPGVPCHARPADLKEECSLLSVPREATIPRTADSIAQAVSLLLRNSRAILLVDPHFEPSAPRWNRPLAALLGEATGGRREFELNCFEYHTQNKAARSHFSCCACSLPNCGQVVHFVQWDHHRVAEQLHGRYILTEIGGVRIDKGLDDSDPEETTDISVLDDKMREHYWNWFHNREAPFRLADEFDIRPTGRV